MPKETFYKVKGEVILKTEIGFRQALKCSLKTKEYQLMKTLKIEVLESISTEKSYKILIKFPQVGTTKKNEQLEEGIFNEMHPVMIRW